MNQRLLVVSTHVNEIFCRQAAARLLKRNGTSNIIQTNILECVGGLHPMCRSSLGQTNKPLIWKSLLTILFSSLFGDFCLYPFIHILKIVVPLPYAQWNTYQKLPLVNHKKNLAAKTYTVYYRFPYCMECQTRINKIWLIRQSGRRVNKKEPLIEVK